MTTILLLSVIVLLIILIILSLRRRRVEIGEASVMKIAAGAEKAASSYLSSVSAIIEREEERTLSLTRLTSDDIKERLERMDGKLSVFTRETSDFLRKEGESAAERALAGMRTLNEGFDRIRGENRELFRGVEEKTGILSMEVKEGLERIRDENGKKLSEIRDTVDMKLQETLDRRIAVSFREVTENLERLHASMGELDALSMDVRKMNDIFSNVKTRGMWGEVQAEAILSDTLSSSEWVKDYSPGGNGRVEFAIRMPGKGGEVYLPIDSKFPVSDFIRYREAVEKGDRRAEADEARKVRERILSEAREISKKYIVPPRTTDFAILFIPSESLYLEVLGMDDLMMKIQSEYRILLAGPNTFAALLNSLRLGFRTMRIEEYTSAIWHLFEDMKKLFSELSKSIDDSRRHMDKASESLECVRRKNDKIGNVLVKIEESSGRPVVEGHAFHEKEIPFHESGKKE